MKKFILISLAGFLFLAPWVRSQNCTVYFPTKKGQRLVYQYYDEKSKPTIKVYYNVQDVTETDKGMKITTQHWIETEDGEMTDTILLDYYCKNGEFYIDMQSTLSSMLSKYEGMDIEIQTKDLALPSTLKEGDVLPDGSATVVVKNNGVKLVTITSTVTNRKVAGKEKVTTPAGTFDCVKVTFDTDGKIGFVKTHAKGAVWYAKGIGTVKTESYNKKGKLEGSSQLIGIE